MNKRISIAIALLLVFSTLISACSNTEPTAATVAQETAQQTAQETVEESTVAAETTEATTSAETEETEKVLRVGALMPLSGYTARYGEEIKDAIDMAMDEIDYQIGPYKVEMVWIDSQADPGKAAQAYEQAIVQNHIDVAIMNWQSSISVACMEIAAKHKIPHFFGFGATEVVNEKYESDPEKYSYWMGKTWPSPYKLTKGYVEALEDAIAAGTYNPETKTVFICGEDTDWGRSMGDGLKMQFEAAGWTTVGEEYFPGGQTEFFPILSKIKQIGPAVIAQSTGGAEVLSAFTKQAVELGVSEESLMIIDGLGWMGEWYELTGDASNYILDQIPEFASEEALAWASEFKEKYGIDPGPSAGGQSYDMTKFFIILAERALEKHGEITSETLYEVGQSELWQGTLVYEDGLIQEMYKYTPETIPDPVVGKGYFIFPVRQYMNGESYIIWPEEWATGELQVP
ncbi:MAG: ABC transporter substrate-binding protein [Anaerolineales bacterium]|nr:ABC transporter substrate-binding protein [Anaerolineales bacterium]